MAVEILGLAFLGFIAHLTDSLKVLMLVEIIEFVFFGFILFILNYVHNAEDNKRLENSNQNIYTDYYKDAKKK